MGMRLHRGDFPGCIGRIDELLAAATCTKGTASACSSPGVLWGKEVNEQRFGRGG
jgi:hypothetical protein